MPASLELLYYSLLFCSLFEWDRVRVDSRSSPSRKQSMNANDINYSDAVIAGYVVPTPSRNT